MVGLGQVPDEHGLVRVRAADLARAGLHHLLLEVQRPRVVLDEVKAGVDEERGVAGGACAVVHEGYVGVEALPV